MRHSCESCGYYGGAPWARRAPQSPARQDCIAATGMCPPCLGAEVESALHVARRALDTLAALVRDGAEWLTDDQLEAADAMSPYRAG